MAYIGNGVGRNQIVAGQIAPGAVTYPTLDTSVTGPLTGFKNKIINGTFDIWQRGTSLSGQGFIADRWSTTSGGTTVSSSRQWFTPGQTDVPGEPTSFHRVVVTSVAGAGNYAQLIQRIESVRTFAGQTATVSFYAKADAAKTIAVSANQYFGAGGSGSVSGIKPAQNQFALTTAWKKFTGVFAFPNITGKTVGGGADDLVQLNFWFDAGSNFNSDTGSLGQQSGTFDIAQVQFEVGPNATEFEYRPFALEVPLVLRYFERVLINGLLAYNQSAGTSLVNVPYFPKRGSISTSVVVGSAWLPENMVTSGLSFGFERHTQAYCTLVVTGSGGQATGTCGRLTTSSGAWIDVNSEL